MVRHIYVLFHKNNPIEVLAAGGDLESLEDYVFEIYGYEPDDENSPYIIERQSVH